MPLQLDTHVRTSEVGRLIQSVFRDMCVIVTTWPFLVSLAALIANDHWLKHVYPGLVSGKLSDFAGIAVVSLLLLAAQPNRRFLVYGAIVFGFAWWKSPLSQPAIDAINSHLSSPIGRTVDYTDLLALLVIPACAVVTSHPLVFVLPGRARRRILVVPLFVLTALGLMATSLIPTRQDYQVRRTDGASSLDREAVAETVSQVAARHGLKCEDCSNLASGGRYSGKGIHLRYVFVEANGISFEVEALPNGLFFGASGREKADRLRDDLKSRLASSYKDLEYVEQLGPGARDTQ